MSDDDWDKDSDTELSKSTSNIKLTSSAPITKAAPKWAEEDAEDDEDVKDDWDVSEDEENNKKPAATSANAAPRPIRQKGITKQKIAEREAEERALADKKAAMLAAEQDPEARKRAARERELKADLENARGLFGDAAVDSIAPKSNDPFSMDPHTLDDFKQFSSALADLIISKHGDKPLYYKFVEEHCRALCAPLKSDQLKPIASGVTALANEKQKAEKTAAGTGKKKKAAAKPVLSAGRNIGRDVSAYDEALDDDFDDFM